METEVTVTIAPAPRPLAAIRYELVEYRIALRNLDDTYILTRALAEQRIIDAAGGDKGLGANEGARARALVIGLASDGDYQASAGARRSLTDAIEHLEREVEDARDLRRDVEWAIRARLADALDRRGVTSDDPQRHSDHEFTDAAIDARIRQVDDDPFS